MVPFSVTERNQDFVLYVFVENLYIYCMYIYLDPCKYILHIKYQALTQMLKGNFTMHLGISQ